MVRFRVIDPRGAVVATKTFDSAEAAYPWFVDSIAGSSELGWRMEVDDAGQWAFFDDTQGFTAPSSRRPAPNRRPSRTVRTDSSNRHG
ncbi:hypothetical protein [Mycobacterium sp.]|uniref:hypothetical protein n=1 Tax=Mycobacterium sp. TaxID=1785 RepID=UPI002CE8C8DD|nr:hypothetical protein [Mycobacterium sp.]HTQ16162.1 hypothetical protein [Mycobacterium sp.]